MNLSTLKCYIYSSLCEHKTDSNHLMKAMLNLMQATYIVLRSSPSLDEETLIMGMNIFQPLFNRYFKETMEVFYILANKCPYKWGRRPVFYVGFSCLH